MARVGTISIDLVAHTGKLIAPLAKASASVKSFVGGLQSTRLGVGSMLAGLTAATGGALSFYAAWSKVKKQFEDIDSIAKSADRLNLTTEQFIGLQHGAGLAGLEVEALTKSVQKMLAQKTIKIAPDVASAASIQKRLDAHTFVIPANVRLPEAKQLQDLIAKGKIRIPAELAGDPALKKLMASETSKVAINVKGKPLTVDADTAKAQKAIDRVRGSAETMVSIKVGDTMGNLEQVADTMALMSSDAERLQYAISILGKDGAKMVDFLKGGAIGLREAQADAEKLGLTLSRVDAAKIEMANDAVTRLQGLVTGVARKIAIELAPFIKFAADQFVVLGTEGEGVGGKVRAGVDMVIGGMGLMLDAVDLARTGWAALQLGAQISLNVVGMGVAYLVKGIEVGTEAIVNGFKWAWSNATQIVQEAVSAMITLLADVANWIESKLPERFQLGIGNAAQEFAKQFDATVAQNRQALNSQQFKVDLTFGDDAMAMSKAFADDTARAAKDFQAFAGRDKMSDKLRRNVEQIRADAQKAAEMAVTTPEGESTFAGADKVNPAALERGSNQAFSAFQKNLLGQKSAEERILEESRKQNAVLAKIEKNTGKNAMKLAPI